MTPDDVGSALERPLGFTEALCARWYTAIPCGLQVVAAARCTRPVDADELVVAVDRIRIRHPGAASCIVDSGDSGLRFAPAPDPVVVSVAPAGARWRDRHATQLASPLDLSRSLWRVELVPSPTDDPEPAVVIVTGCHALLDGISVATVTRELLDGPDRPDDSEPGTRFPAMEDLLPVGAPSAAPAMSPPAERWPVACRADAAARAYGFTDRAVDLDTISALEARGHAEGTTVGALLGVACTRARAVVPGARDDVGFNVPYDVRPRVVPPLPAGAVGAYFGRAHVYASGTTCDTDPWSAARDLSAQLGRELAAMARPESWDDRSVRSLLDDICRDDRSSFDLGVMLTDLGRCDLGSSVSAFFVTTVQTTGVEALVVSAASPAGRGLCLGIGWPRPLVDDVVAQRFADEVVTQVTRLAGS